MAGTKGVGFYAYLSLLKDKKQTLSSKSSGLAEERETIGER